MCGILVSGYKLSVQCCSGQTVQILWKRACRQLNVALGSSYMLLRLPGPHYSLADNTHVKEVWRAKTAPSILLGLVFNLCSTRSMHQLSRLPLGMRHAYSKLLIQA